MTDPEEIKALTKLKMMELQVGGIVLERVAGDLKEREKVITDLKKLSGCANMEIATKLEAAQTNHPSCNGVIYSLKLHTAGATYGEKAVYVTNKDVHKTFILATLKQVKSKKDNNAFAVLASNSKYDINLTKNFPEAMDKWEGGESEVDAFLALLKGETASKDAIITDIKVTEVIIKCEFENDKEDLWEKDLE